METNSRSPSAAVELGLVRPALEGAHVPDEVGGEHVEKLVVAAKCSSAFLTTSTFSSDTPPTIHRVGRAPSRARTAGDARPREHREPRREWRGRARDRRPPQPPRAPARRNRLGSSATGSGSGIRLGSTHRLRFRLRLRDRLGLDRDRSGSGSVRARSRPVPARFGPPGPRPEEPAPESAPLAQVAVSSASLRDGLLRERHLRDRRGGSSGARAPPVAIGSGSSAIGSSASGPAIGGRLLPPLRAGSSGSSACRVTFVPHPEGSIETVPLACSPSQATVCSGSSFVILISPKAPRCLARPSTSLSSSQSSGGDLTRVRFAVRSGIDPGFDHRRRSPADQ